MAQKGEKLSPEHKKKLRDAQEKARMQKEQRKAESRAEREAKLESEGTQADREAAEAAEQAELEEYNRPRPHAAPVPTTAPSGVSQGVTEWGPYEDYTMVTTPWGLFAVEPGYIMRFTERSYFSQRERRNVVGHFPYYTHIDGRSRDEKMGLVPPLQPVI